MKLLTMPSCIPCKMVKEYFQQNDITNVEILDVTEHEDIVEQYHIKQTPSLILDDDTVLAGKDNIIEHFEEEEE